MFPLSATSSIVIQNQIYCLPVPIEQTLRKCRQYIEPGFCDKFLLHKFTYRKLLPKIKERGNAATDYFISKTLKQKRHIK